MKPLSTFIFVCLFFIKIGTAQESIVDFRFTDRGSDCSGDEVCFDIQLRTNQANQADGSIELADVNYRIFYPNKIMTFASVEGTLAGYFSPNLDEAGPLGDEVLDLFGDAFDGTDGLGFVDFSIQVNGNSNSVTLTDQWLTTAIICFNPVEILLPLYIPDGDDINVVADFCTQIIWSIPEYNGEVNFYRFAYLTATEVENGGGSNVQEVMEVAIHYQWAEDDMAFPTDCQVNLCTLLPVELIEFSADLHDEKQVKLQWSTASEQYSDKYVIERKGENETEFHEVGKVEAAGASNSTLNYQYLDQLPLNGQTFYYRLKMLNLDGTFDYSAIKSVYKISDQKDIKLYPNPSHGFINLELPSEQNESVSVEVFDYTGKQKLMNTEVVNQGAINQTINLSQLANGYYIVKINVGTDVLIQSVQIQK